MTTTVGSNKRSKYLTAILNGTLQPNELIIDDAVRGRAKVQVLGGVWGDVEKFPKD